jgi:hypothetical protein
VTEEPTITVCWIGWLPLSLLCGVGLGFVVGVAVGVFA